MSEVEAVPPPVPPDIEKVDIKNDVYLNIEPEGEELVITLRAPKVAEIIQKMATGNYRREEMDKSLTPCMLAPTPPEGVTEARAKELRETFFLTRPAISRITKNFAGATAIDFSNTPPAALMYNHEALVSGLVIKLKMEKPPAPELLRKWGKQVIDGIADIVANARPFKMTWTMTETPKVSK